MSHEVVLPIHIDVSAERCSRSVRALATMTRVELVAHLEATARASASVLVARATRPKSKAKSFRRTPRHLLGR